MTSIVAANWDSLILHEINPTDNEIGRGAYGRVFEVNYEGTVCAAKEVHALLLQSTQGDDLQNSKIKDNFLSECQIWSTLRHPCIVQFLGVYYPETDQYKLPVVVMEKMQQSLKDLMEKHDDIPLNVKLSILDEVCLGLRYLHTRNPPIVHRDLTPNNILLGRHLEAKITDLGVAKVMQTTDKKTMTKAPGTHDFMPPECLADRPVYGLSLDIFSYGGVILYTITHQWPQPSSWVKFDPNTDTKVVLSELERRQRYLDEMTGDAADLKPLVASCLNDNPKNRPPAAQVSLAIKMLKDVCSQKSGHDGLSPIVWWAKVSDEQQSQMTSSLTVALEEMTVSNDELKREIDALKAENSHLAVVLKKMDSNNENQMQQINSQSGEIDAMREEIAQLKAKNHQLKRHLALKTPGELFNGAVNIQWENGAPAPVHCALHTAVWLNGRVYIGGSFEAGWKDSYAIYCYDPVDNSWSSRPPIYTPYCYFAMTVLNDNLLIVGGRDKFDKKTDQILTMDAGKLRNYTRMNTARSSPTAVGHQGMLIITGGVDDKNKTLSSTELYNSTSGHWHTCSKIPRPHYRLQSVIVDNILYLLGGYDDDGVSPAVFAAPLDTLSRHQLKWNTHQDTPWCHCAPVSVCGTHLLTVGGDNEIGNEVRLTPDIYKFNKISQNWETIGQIPAVRESSAAVSTTDNKLIVIGGRDDKELCTNTVWIGSCEPQ